MEIRTLTESLYPLLLTDLTQLLDVRIAEHTSIHLSDSQTEARDGFATSEAASITLIIISTLLLLMESEMIFRKEKSYSMAQLTF